MKIKTLLFIVTLLGLQNVIAQNPVGSWKGNLEVMGTELPIIFHIQKEKEHYSATFDSPKQGAKGIPIKQTIIKNDSIIFDASNLGIQYKGLLLDKKIEGIFLQSGMKLPLDLSPIEENESVFNRPQTPKPPFSYNNEEVSFPNEKEGNKLAGTLTTPKDFDKKEPIVVFITGSGPQDRNEELFGHQPFLVIADDLAKKGIASLRLDDRGVGDSEQGKENPTSEDFSDDILSAVHYLKNRGFKNIGLIGHSEGGMIAPMVALQSADVQFMVLLASPGIPIKDLMLKQSELITKSSNLSPKEIAKINTFNNEAYDLIINYEGTDLANYLTEKLKDDYIALYENQSLENKHIETQFTNMVNSMSSEWYRYFIKFNPQDYFSKIKIPVLALNGDLDLQVSSKENLAGIEKSLRQAKNQNFEIRTFKKLNHLFQTAQTGAPTEYAEIEETIAPEVLETISSWIKNIVK
ncbi:alpha/beta hydrolase [Weeksellaceae bacterium TAE3-ERU29]|nr:alpha/beta hydrolase [Weeksellaceae bacterium TAE3-ERU29]